MSDRPEVFRLRRLWKTSGSLFQASTAYSPSVLAQSMLQSGRFTCRLKPVGEGADPEAMAVTGLSLDELRVSGLEPFEAMTSFAEWLVGVASEGARPIFIGLNAPFDWSFVNYYFHRFVGENPFGFVALDIKAFYMGVTGCRWAETKSSAMASRLRPTSSGTHDALQDALYQAELFRLARDLRANGVI